MAILRLEAGDKDFTEIDSLGAQWVINNPLYPTHNCIFLYDEKGSNYGLHYDKEGISKGLEPSLVLQDENSNLKVILFGAVLVTGIGGDDADNVGLFNKVIRGLDKQSHIKTELSFKEPKGIKYPTSEENGNKIGFKKVTLPVLLVPLDSLKEFNSQV